tara:strand:+ start:50 stop:181 length:132 start_codon:yes stop_codon:yes gene_type:complete
MIKKITIAIILCFIIISCGKKGDPIYKKSQNKIELQKILTNKT